MSRYIDADHAEFRLQCCGTYHGVIAFDTVKAVLNDAPSIDIVRCKECRYCKMKRGTFKGEPIIFYRCEENNRDVESDDYCSLGERREP